MDGEERNRWLNLTTYLADKDAQSEKRRGASRHRHVAPRS